MKMASEKPILTPFYEYLDSIVSLTQLQINKDTISKTLNNNSFQKLEFSLNLESVNILLKLSTHRSKTFDIRAIIRFYKSEYINETTSQLVMTDIFPRHLKIDVNGVSIPLPAYLPYDRFRKDGRRHPRPVDLTDALCDHPPDGGQHACVIQWMPDDYEEKYFFVVHLVRRRSCEELTLILAKKQRGLVENSLNLIGKPDVSCINGNHDNDLMSTDGSLITSLICPVSFMRMAIPVRGKDCRHLQCFDCATYLAINFHKPTWQCPICDRSAIFMCLEVDGLILDVINDERSTSVTKVAFNQLGQWRSVMDDESGGNTNEALYMANDCGEDRPTEMWHSISKPATAAIPIDDASSGYVSVDEPRSVNELRILETMSVGDVTDEPYIIQPGTSVDPIANRDCNSSHGSFTIPEMETFMDTDDPHSSVKLELRNLLSSGIPKLAKLQFINECRKLFKHVEKEEEDIKEHRDVINDNKVLDDTRNKISTIVDGNPLIGKCEWIEEDELLKNRERLLPRKCKEDYRKMLGMVMNKQRESRATNRSVGRPRKEGMAPPPTSALREVTKALIKAKYLMKHPEK